MTEFLAKNRVLSIVLALYLFLCVALIIFINNPPDSVIENLFHRAVAQGQNPGFIDEDALYVITTGTGSPMPDKKRAGSQTVVVAGDQILVFDAGPGSTHKLELTRLDVGSINALFITHYHSDHIGDIGELMLKRWAYGSRRNPLPIYGPPGIEQVVSGFNSAYQLDKEYRVAHHGEKVMPPSGFGGRAQTFDLGSDLASSRTVYKSGEVEVIAFNVAHDPVHPAVGYRVHYKDRSIAITGDTRYTESLIEHTRDADVLISEALNMRFVNVIADAGKGMDNNVTKIAEDIQTYHISPEQAATVAKEAGVSQLILTHIVPPVPTDFLVKPFLKGTRQIYSGGIHLANDGTLVRLTTNSDNITLKEILK